MKRVRLEALRQRARFLKVDRTFPGSIEGLSVLTTGEALGHGFAIDDVTVAQVDQALDGVPGRWTHGGLSDDGLGRHLGKWRRRGVESFLLCRGCKVEAPIPAALAEPPPCPSCAKPLERASRAVGDFMFTESAHRIRPDGIDVAAPVYLMDRAEEDPSSFGVSIVADLEVQERKDELPLVRLAEGRALHRADFVADPAANPLGLHAGTGTLSALSEEATEQLDRLVARLGKDEARKRALAFLDRAFGRLSMNATTDADDDERLAAENRALRAELASIKAALLALEEAEDARKKKEADAYVAQLRRKAVELGSPIPEDDLARVAAAFERGEEETARALGQAFFSRAQALAGRGKSTKTIPLTGSREQDEREVDEDLERRKARLGLGGRK